MELMENFLNQKLMIGIVHKETGYSMPLLNMFSFRRPLRTAFVSNMTHDIGNARNDVCRVFLESDLEWLLFIDSDHYVVPSQRAFIERLMNHNLPIVSGLYYQRMMPFYPILLYRCKDGKLRYKYIKEDYPKDQLVEVDGHGAGCLLIKREVIEKMDKPYFRRDFELDVGEDIGFCIKAVKMGYKLYVDTGVKFLHYYSEVTGPQEEKLEYYRYLLRDFNPENIIWREEK